MKHLLEKFRLSNSLDREAGAPGADSLRAKISADPELRDFANQADAVDRALRRPPIVPANDPILHNSIMCAVRNSAAESAPKRTTVNFGLATATLAIAAVVVWLAVRPAVSPKPTHAQTMAMAQVVMDMGGELSRNIPGAVVAPLSNELASVDHDIRDTTQFVMGILP